MALEIHSRHKKAVLMGSNLLLNSNKNMLNLEELFPLAEYGQDSHRLLEKAIRWLRRRCHRSSLQDVVMPIMGQLRRHSTSGNLQRADTALHRLSAAVLDRGQQL